MCGVDLCCGLCDLQVCCGGAGGPVRDDSVIKTAQPTNDTNTSTDTNSAKI